MAETFLTSPLLQNIILPFVLIFTLIFAILQRSKILGDGKKQIDALVAASIGLIVISYGFAVGVISSLLPFLAISAVVILVFMILYGFIVQDKISFHKSVNVIVGILAALGVIITVLVATGAYDYLVERFFVMEGETFSNTLIFLVLVVGAVLLVMFSGGKSGGDKDKK